MRICSKCKGSGEYHFNNGMVGICYGCNGTGKVKESQQIGWTARIAMDDSLVPQDWIGISARTENEAHKKAVKTAERGIYKKYIDTIEIIKR